MTLQEMNDREDQRETARLLNEVLSKSDLTDEERQRLVPEPLDLAIESWMTGGMVTYRLGPAIQAGELRP